MGREGGETRRGGDGKELSQASKGKKIVGKSFGMRALELS